jgi:circadian clock protein KaiC
MSELRYKGAMPTRPERSKKTRPQPRGLAKAPTGVAGFDEITYGGVPRGRPTLLCGAAGCGKTLFGMQFLVRGALDYGEPGVFVAFEERESDLVQNVASLGFDLADLIDRKLLALDHVHIESSQIEENGEYDLEGLFVRLDAALSSVKAKRLVIDTLETIFSALSNQAVLRAELVRLFSWLKERGVTTIITAEKGDGALTRHGLEEYVSDCVVVLDHRVNEQISTRRLRVAKYRGSMHGTNEYPFLIESTGISVVPITAAALEHKVSRERVPTGVSKLDDMLGGGYYRGSTVLISGTAGAGKSSLCAHFADASCENGDVCLYVAYEESPDQIIRNMSSLGLDLERWIDQKRLRIMALRPTSHGLEDHLSLLRRAVAELGCKSVILDPIGTLSGGGTLGQAHDVVVRMIDLLKNEGITTMLTNLTHGGEAAEQTAIAISSLVDTWLLVKTIEANGERNRGMYVLKSRGMSHSNQIREFVITSQGIDLIEPYVGAEGVLTGTARFQQEAAERAAQEQRKRRREDAERLLERKRTAMLERVSALKAEFEAESAELLRSIEDAAELEAALAATRDEMGRRRGANGAGASSKKTNGKARRFAQKPRAEQS